MKVTTIQVENMKTEQCESKISKALYRIKGIMKVGIYLPVSLIYIQGDEKVQRHTILNTLKAEGYSEINVCDILEDAKNKINIFNQIA
jgi:copper chaperone CopZ